MTDTPGFIPVHGGYENLVTYQKAEIVYDATVEFCALHLRKGDRTCDQMVQAARSGKQNIIEGSMASATSREIEIKLTNVARASLEELLEDYRDFLRTRGSSLWHKDSKEARYVRQLSRQATPGRRQKHGTNAIEKTYERHETPAPDKHNSLNTQETSSYQSSHLSHTSHLSHSPYSLFRPIIQTRPPEVAANIIICLIHQANYLLDRQIRQQEKTFLEQGGLREAMTRARLAERDKQHKRVP